MNSVIILKDHICNIAKHCKGFWITFGLDGVVWVPLFAVFVLKHNISNVKPINDVLVAT